MYLKWKFLGISLWKWIKWILFYERSPSNIIFVGAWTSETRNGLCHQKPNIRTRPITPGLAHIVKVIHEWDEISSLIKWARVLGEIELHSSQIGPNTDRPAKGKAMRRKSNRGQYQALSMTLGNSLPNTNWRLEQVPRESSEVMRIHGDSEGYGSMCQVGK